VKDKVLAFLLKKINWGKILPVLLKKVAEGNAGPLAQRIYWATAKYKTLTGAILLALGTGSEAVCGSFPQWAWTCEVGPWIYWVGMVLTAVGLADGGTRSPWPNGTPKEGK
jgi:hypothetical protein